MCLERFVCVAVIAFSLNRSCRRNLLLLVSEVEMEPLPLMSVQRDRVKGVFMHIRERQNRIDIPQSIKYGIALLCMDMQ